MEDLNEVEQEKSEWPDYLKRIELNENHQNICSCCTKRKQKIIWKTFSHASIVGLLAAYTAVGAIIFRALEHPNEIETTKSMFNDMQKEKQNLSYFLWEYAHVDKLEKENWTTIAISNMDDLEEKLYSYFRKGMRPPSEKYKYKWTYSASLFFAATVISTIGYGHITPRTIGGRTFCMLFALFGIPILLIAVTDLGKFFANFLNFSYKKIHLRMKLRCKNIDQTLKKKRTQKLPYSFVFIILILYIALGGIMFAFWEDWSFFEAFYFCFITMSTIGFGDIVPKHQMYMLLCAVYILIGLALTSTCVELAKRQYERSIKSMKKVRKQIAIPQVKVMSKISQINSRNNPNKTKLPKSTTADSMGSTAPLVKNDSEKNNPPENENYKYFVMYETST